MQLHRAQEAAEQQSCQHARKRAQHDRNRNDQKGRGGQRAARNHGQKGIKQHDHIDIIHRSARKHELRDAVLCAEMETDQADHARHDNRRRHRRKHGSDERRLRCGHAEDARGEQNNAQNFQRGGDEAHQQRRTSDCFEIVQPKRETRAGQDDDQCDAPQVAGDGQHGFVQQTERAEQQTRADHADQRRQTAQLRRRAERETEQDDECKTCEHNILLCNKNKSKLGGMPGIL